MKTAIVLYELEHLVVIDALKEKWGADACIVSLDAEIDFALGKRGMPFVSGQTLQNRFEPSAYMRAHEITRAICEDEGLQFLSYRGISLLKPLRLSIHQYFQNLCYYVDIFDRYLAQFGDIELLIVPAKIVPLSQTSAPLAREEVHLVSHAAELVTKSHNIRYVPYEMATPARYARNVYEAVTFSLKRALFGFAISFLNVVVMLRPRRPLRLLASDYWRNIVPVLTLLSTDVEVVMVDRGEALSAGWRNIWRYKMRFMHIDRFLSWRGSLRARMYAKACQKKWNAARTLLWQDRELVYCKTNLQETAQMVMDRLMASALSEVLRDIEGTYAMYARLTPDVVWLRASISAQRHFAILPLVAEVEGTPALEVQHGGEYLGPGSPTQEHPSQYLAVYGKLIADELRELGYAKERLIDAGSPRFDSYVEDCKPRSKTVREGITILTNTPNINIGERYGTYSIEEYFKALGDAVSMVPTGRLLVASRSTHIRSQFLHDARERGLQGILYEMVGTTPLPELFRQADFFVCSHSTVVYEALLYRLPVIIASFAPVEKMMTDFHFGKFEKAGALLIAHTPDELRDLVGKLASDESLRTRMIVAGEAFMQEQFSFDGHASERIAAELRSWAHLPA